MNTDASKEEAIFDTAVEINDPDERASFLDEACAGDDALRTSVERLLEYDETSGDFLETPAVGPARSSRDEPQGSMIGPYRIIERLGEGGFGVVYRAEQHDPVHRQVAFKIIKLGMDSRQIIARFQAERQALAMMKHGNIATVLDAGSTDRGRPYFVMELVEGQSIDRFSIQARLPLRQRLELFIDVCRAVHHAHQKGVIHRDLKPSNILVSDNDGQLVPKNIDFWIAKAIHAPLAGDDLATASLQLVGTPEYMSPEQVNSDPDIDTRSDVYALGAVLFKLLIGVAPLDTATLRRTGFEELARAIREDDPVRPSKRLAHQLNQTVVSSVDEGLHDPRDISPRKLRGDLDSIVMKALEKERTRRYESAAKLASDLQRHLAGEPVSAEPRSSVYRLQKFVRRNRVAVFAASVAVIALVSGTIAAAAGFVKAEREGAYARQQWERAEQERVQADHHRRRAVAEAEKSKEVVKILEELIGATHRGAVNPSGSILRETLDRLADDFEGSLLRAPGN
jgi:serine/threonine protein kinase